MDVEYQCPECGFSVMPMIIEDKRVCPYCGSRVITIKPENEDAK